MDLINNNSDILNGYTLKLLQGDSGCNIRSKANQVFFEHVMYGSSAPLGIVGPGCSNSALTVSFLSGQRQFSILTIHVAGSPLLSDRTLYNYSFGTLDSTEVFVWASLALMRKNNWEPVGILYDDSRLFYSSTVYRFEEHLTSANISYFSFAVYDTFIPLNVLVMERIRVIFLFVGPDYLSRILCLAYHSNMLYPIYQFVTVSRVVDEIQPVTFHYIQTVTCREEDMVQVINGSLIIHYQLENTEGKTDVGISYKQFFEVYEKRVSDYNDRLKCLPDNNVIRTPIQPSFWAASFFDTVWSMALALNSSTERLGFSNDSEYGYGSGVADILKENLLNQNFSGLSGRISYNSSSGYVIRNVNVYQVDSNRHKNWIAFYTRLNDSIVLTSTKDRFINATFRTESTITSISFVIGGLFLSVTVISFIVTLTLHILIVVHSKQKSVKASSTTLSHIAFAGCYLLAFCGLLHFMVQCLSGFIPPLAECNLCHVLNSATAIGGTLLLGPICARTWRLYRIYVHFQNPGSLISNWFLLLMMFVLLAISSMVAILSITIHPFQPIHVNNSRIEAVKDLQGNIKDYMLIETVTIICTQDYHNVWVGVLFTFPAILMLLAFWLAVLTRHITHKNFRTHSIMLLVYLLSGFLSISLPLYFIPVGNALFKFIVLSVILDVCVLLPCLLLFLPPLYPILKQKLRCCTVVLLLQY